MQVMQKMQRRLDNAELVVLVDESDAEVGVCEKLEAHTGGGRLHRAFSVFLHDGMGRQMLQRRALTKYHFAGLWSNACCSHPRPGERPEAGAVRRLGEELGVRGVVLAPLGRFIYEARDGATGLIEREVDHVFAGVYTGEAQINPEEAAGVRWVEPGALDRELSLAPERFTPWFPIALAHARRVWAGPGWI